MYLRDTESALPCWVPRGSQRELSIAWEQSGTHYKTLGLGSEPWEARIQNECISPYRFHKAAVLHGHRKESGKDVSLGGKENGGPLEASSCDA